jgi:chaperonin GroEL
LGAILGEMVDLLGMNGAIVIQDYYSPYLEREYLSGGRWSGRPAAREFLPAGKPEIAYENPLLLVANQEIEALDPVRAVLEMASTRQSRRPVIIIARNVKGMALTTLLMNTTRGTVETAGLIPAGNLFRVEEDLADIALLTGARMIDPEAGGALERIQLIDLGQAQRVLFTQQNITIVGGAGNQAALQKRVSELRGQLRQLKRMDPKWEKLRFRAARLSGGIGILKIGATYEKEREIRKESARKAIRILNAAIDEGVLPGGGVAYLNCQVVVRAAKSKCADPDEANGIEIVANALEAPFRQIVANDGHVSPSVALEQAKRLGLEYGYDVNYGQYVNMGQAGIVDSASILIAALQAAASSAAMLLTTAAIVLRRNK